MKKAELISKVVELSGLSKKDSTAGTEAVLQAIAGALASGDAVKIQNFGNFEVRERSARKGINPKLLKELKEQGIDADSAREQASIEIDASKSVGFKPAKSLKDSLN